jgi:ribosomal protein RSM22 (predicted rRNA methylase)
MHAGADKPQIRQKALKLYDYFRSTSATAYGQKGKRAMPHASDNKLPQIPFLDGNTALAYASGVMPGIYASTLAVLSEAQKRLSLQPDEDGQPWMPKKIVDWGAGLGTAAL